MTRIAITVLVISLAAAPRQVADRVQTSSGVVEGIASAVPGVRAFLGIPYAAPPVGAKRWTSPEAPASWTGVRKTNTFGNRCIQTRVSPDTTWRSAVESEDCLYLSIWTPTKTGSAGLPVMVWIHGGGFNSGASDEARYDGASLASRGVVLITINYRLGVMGFLAHPELTAESKEHASGNYGLLDQVAALRWVKDNAARFGGHPDRVTIFGQSAGSSAVSGLMASPLAVGLFQRAIGQSGAMFSARSNPFTHLDDAERSGITLATKVGASSLAALRAVSAADLVKAAGLAGPIIDGYMLTDDPWNTFAGGRQHRVSLLAGWNSAEIKSRPTTPVAFASRLRVLFPSDVEAAQKAYTARDDRDATLSAVALSSDGSFAYQTWKWIEAHAATGRSPVYRYFFDQIVPTETGDPSPDDPGAAHETDIEYVFNTLDTRKVAWRAADRRVADMMSAYWTNFARTGNPNAPGLPNWPALGPSTGRQVMRINADAHVETEGNRVRYEFLDMLERRKRSTK